MSRPRPSGTTRIQREKRSAIFQAALDIFAENGLRGATLDQIAARAGLSKPNVIYYFEGKEAIYTELLESLLDVWVDPLRQLSADGEPIEEILAYTRRKLAMSRDMPRESRLFATEIIQNAPRVRAVLEGPLKSLVDEKAAVVANWVQEGRIAPVDPYHLFFSLWAMTQHYADFDLQVGTVLGPARDQTRYEDADAYLTSLIERLLKI